MLLNKCNLCGKNNIITIEENETESLCNCLCLFDLDFEIHNIQPGVYTIKIVEPYLYEGEDILEFAVDLSAATSGSFCVNRYLYPWEF